MTNFHINVPGQDPDSHHMSATAGQHRDEQGTGGSDPGKVLNMLASSAALKRIQSWVGSSASPHRMRSSVWELSSECVVREATGD